MDTRESDLFWILAMMNSYISISNLLRNSDEIERQKRIEDKLDKVLEIMGKDEETR